MEELAGRAGIRKGYTFVLDFSTAIPKMAGNSLVLKKEKVELAGSGKKKGGEKVWGHHPPL